MNSTNETQEEKFMLMIKNKITKAIVGLMVTSIVTFGAISPVSAMEGQSDLDNNAGIKTQCEYQDEAVGLARVLEAKELGVTPGKLNLVQKLIAIDVDDDIDDDAQALWLEKPVKEINKAIRESKKAQQDKGQGNGKGNSDNPVTPDAPSVTSDDDANTVTGMTTAAMEYKLDAADYVVYDATAFDLLDFSGAHTLLVRVAAEGINPVSADTTLTFTTNPVTPDDSAKSKLFAKLINTYDKLLDLYEKLLNSFELATSNL